MRALETIPLDALCVTSGALSASRIDAPTVRAVALGHAGDAAAMRFRLRGTTDEQRALDSGALRHQLGFKLRAQDACNVVYVMWRFGPAPRVEVQLKRNADAHTSHACGSQGYRTIRPRVRRPPPLETEGTHELRAEIAGDRLTAWIDGHVVWQGALPTAANELVGPAGIRTDNVDVDILELDVDARVATGGTAKCAGADPTD